MFVEFPVGKYVIFCQRQIENPMKLRIEALSSFPRMKLHLVLSQLRQRQWSLEFRNADVG